MFVEVSVSDLAEVTRLAEQKVARGSGALSVPWEDLQPQRHVVLNSEHIVSIDPQLPSMLKGDGAVISMVNGEKYITRMSSCLVLKDTLTGESE